MSTFQPHMPIDPWTCPNCHQRWYSGTQHCRDCEYQDGAGQWHAIPKQPLPATVLPGQVNGQVLGPNGQPVQTPPIQATPADSYRQQYDELVQATAQHNASVDHATSEAVNQWLTSPSLSSQGLAEELRRSMAAENALHAEMQPLRERCAHLEHQLEAQKAQLMTGVQRLLQPLVDWLTHQGYQATPSSCIPMAVQLFQQWQQEMHQLRMAASQPQPQGQIGTVAQPHVLLQILSEVQQMRHAMSQQTQGPVSNEPLPSWVVTDRRESEIEQELLRQQTLRGNHGFPR